MSRTVANWTVNYVHEGTPHVKLFKLFFMLLRHQLRSLHGTPSNNEILIFLLLKPITESSFLTSFLHANSPHCMQEQPTSVFRGLNDLMFSVTGDYWGAMCVFSNM